MPLRMQLRRPPDKRKEGAKAACACNGKFGSVLGKMTDDKLHAQCIEYVLGTLRSAAENGENLMWKARYS